MGSEDPDANLEDGEGPVRRIQIDAFHISPTAVSNADFERFVDATDYRTEAEGYGWSYVFKGLLPRSKQRKLGRSNDVKQVPWWIAVEDASWRKPEGSGSNIRKRLDHPVVHVSWNDAVAYCNWSGYRLPSEAEWEYAARGGQIHKRFPWGDQLTPRGKHQCNIWQGSFPDHNTEADGYLSTAPVRSFPKNGIGLYNMSGNVWEWCADWWSPDWHRHHALDNPRGPDSGDQKVLKGGSYLCHETYCNRYRVAARYANTPDSTTGHAGFRVAL
ncbi:MAG: formylglycine-generating enzyme family protein [Pseudomonadota bacterium]